MMKKNRWIYWIKIIAGIALVIFLYQKINERESIVEAFRLASWKNICIGFLLVIPNLYIAYLKWRFILKKRFDDIKRGDVFGSLLLGYTLGLITPGRLGELARSIFFQDRNRTHITGLNLLDKAANQVIIFTLGMLSLVVFVFAEGLWISDPTTSRFIMSLSLTILGLLVILFMWLVILNPAVTRRVLFRLSSRLPQDSKIRIMLNAFQNFQPLTSQRAIPNA